MTSEAFNSRFVKICPFLFSTPFSISVTTSSSTFKSCFSSQRIIFCLCTNKLLCNSSKDILLVSSASSIDRWDYIIEFWSLKCIFSTTLISLFFSPLAFILVAIVNDSRSQSLLHLCGVFQIPSSEPIIEPI